MYFREISCLRFFVNFKSSLQISVFDVIKELSSAFLCTLLHCNIVARFSIGFTAFVKLLNIHFLSGLMFMNKN